MWYQFRVQTTVKLHLKTYFFITETNDQFYLTSCKFHFVFVTTDNASAQGSHQQPLNLFGLRPTAAATKVLVEYIFFQTL
jgi:hypothetical protein